MFHLPELEERRQQRRREKLALVARLNHKQCQVRPVYGTDVCEAVNVRTDNPAHGWADGYLHCLNVHSARYPNRGAAYWSQTRAFSDIIHTPELYVEELREIVDR